MTYLAQLLPSTGKLLEFKNDSPAALWLYYAPLGAAASVRLLMPAHRSQVVPSDVARMVLFLASADAAMCTAQEFKVDAGWN